MRSEVVNGWEQWSDGTEGVAVSECDHCCTVRLVIFSDDPFMAEVYPPEGDEPPLEQTSWCRPCYMERRDEV